MFTIVCDTMDVWIDNRICSLVVITTINWSHFAASQEGFRLGLKQHLVIKFNKKKISSDTLCSGGNGAKRNSTPAQVSPVQQQSAQHCRTIRFCSNSSFFCKKRSDHFFPESVRRLIFRHNTQLQGYVICLLFMYWWEREHLPDCLCWPNKSFFSKRINFVWFAKCDFIYNTSWVSPTIQQLVLRNHSPTQSSVKL